MARRLTLSTVGLILVFGQLLWPQDPGAPRSGTSKVRIYLSVLDKQEKPVLGLTAGQFELRIDGRPSALEGFRAGLPHTDRSIPLVLWILIDFNPNINADMIKRQADAAAKAFDLFDPASAIGVKLVTDRSETLASLAHDPKALRRAFADFSQRRFQLRPGAQDDTVEVGRAGLLGAADRAIEELVNYSLTDPTLKSREVHRAIMIISDGNVDPYSSKKPLYEKASEASIFLYPVFVPRAGPYGLWVEYYFDLAKKTGGVASVIGALSPGSRILPLPRSDTHANALTFNLIHLARDLNGKYSFEVDAPLPGREVHLDLKTKMRNVQIRMPRRILP